LAKSLTFPNGKKSIILTDAEKEAAARTLRLAERGVCLWGNQFKDNARDACKFIFGYIHTQEETTGAEMRIPRKRYLMNIARNWYKCRKAGRTFYIHKSRRLIVSWFVRSLELYAAGFSSAGFGIAAKHFQGMNGACAFVWRVYFLYEGLRSNYPEWNLEKSSPRGAVLGKELDTLILPNGAMFYALNSDKEGVRGGGMSYIAYEELSGYSNPDAVIGQGKIIVQGPAGEVGGMVCAISNASANHEYKAQIKGNHQIRPVVVPDKTYNADAGGLVQVVHYKADPAKNDDWVALTKPGIPPREWEVEMELSDEIHAGDPVHAQFDYAIHAPESGRHELWKIDPNGELIGSWDCSTSTVNFAFTLKQVTKNRQGEDQEQTLLEYTSGGASNIYAFGEGLTAHLRRNYPKLEVWRVEHIGDPAMLARSGTDPMGRTMQEIIRSLGFNIKPAPTQNVQDRLNGTDRLQSQTLSDGTPRWVVNEYGCPTLTEALKGAYCWREVKNANTGGQTVYKEPAKNGFSHVAEASQYGDLVVDRRINNPKQARETSGGMKFNEKAAFGKPKR
jgi:hypothetical protein